MPTLVFWLDVDNTLLNNDEVKIEQDQALQNELGPELAKNYWDIYEDVRHELGVVNIPLALERFREQVPESVIDNTRYEHVVSLFMNYPFPKQVYPGALETLSYLSTLGTTVVVSDGDLTYQAEKIFESNIANAVDGRVLLYVHKQEHLDEIKKKYPADHAVTIDDKPQILEDIKSILGDSVTTVFVEQGKYAKEGFSEGFTPDIAVKNIADVQHITVEQFLGQNK